MPFAKPAPMGESIDFKDHVGALLLVKVDSVEKDIQTVHGLSDAIRADVHVLDGPGAGGAYIDGLIFPRVLQGQLRKNVGKMVLGRLAQGEAKPGQTAPWVLNDASAEDEARAEQWVKENTTPATVQPSAPFQENQGQAAAPTSAPPF